MSVIFVDVDDTIVRSIGSKRIPMPNVIRHIKQLALEGHELYLWSSGGAKYAKDSALERRTRHFGPIRVRMVEYTPGYMADHWCVKGHILLCLEGKLETELEDGRVFTLTPGTSYQVADNAEPHRSSTDIGAMLFIVD